MHLILHNRLLVILELQLTELCLERVQMRVVLAAPAARRARAKRGLKRGAGAVMGSFSLVLSSVEIAIIGFVMPGLVLVVLKVVLVILRRRLLLLFFLRRPSAVAPSGGIGRPAVVVIVGARPAAPAG
jgi:hypothetical protein